MATQSGQSWPAYSVSPLAFFAGHTAVTVASHFSLFSPCHYLFTPPLSLFHSPSLFPFLAFGLPLSAQLNAHLRSSFSVVSGITAFPWQTSSFVSLTHSPHGYLHGTLLSYCSVPAAYPCQRLVMGMAASVAEVFHKICVIHFGFYF